MRRPGAWSSGFGSITLILCSLTLALGPVGRAHGAAAAAPLRVTVGTLGAIGSLDPRRGDSVIAREVWNLQYPTLTAIDPTTLDPVPGLAAAWSPAPHGHGWIYNLRPGLSWSDGQPVTAADVIYSLNHARDDHWPYAANTFDGLHVRAVNEHSVEVTPTRGGGSLPALPLHVVPEHVFSKTPDVGTDVAKLSVSDGTWHVVTKAATSVELDTTRGPSGPPVQQILFRTYPSAGSLIEALARRQVDVVSGVPDADIDRLVGLSNVTVDHAGDGTEYVLKPVSFPNVRLQRVVSLAIDRPELVAHVVNGVGTPAAIAAQPARARADLRAIDPNHRLDPSIAIPTDPTSREVGAFVRRSLSAVGMNTRAMDVDPNAKRVSADLELQRVAVTDHPTGEIRLFEPDTLQAFRTDNVSGFLPQPQRRSLVVFGPTVSRYSELVAASPPAGEQSTNAAYVAGAVILLALCAATLAVAAWIRRRSFT